MNYPEVTISSVATFTNGFPFKPDDWTNDGYPIIRIQNLTDPSKVQNRTKRGVPRKYLVRKGDILVSWSATIDVFEWEREDSLLNQHIFKVDFDRNRVDKRYFKLALKKTIRDLTKFAHGSTMKHVVKGDFDNHKIPLPNLDDQLRIAHLLGKVEGLIAQRKQHLQQLDDLLKSVFLEMFGFLDDTYKKSKIESLSEHAAVVSGVTKGKRYKDDELIEVPYMRVANVQDGHFILDEIKTIAVTRKEVEQYQLMRGDLLLTEGGDPDKLGRGAVWEGQVENCIHQNHIFRVRIRDTDELNPCYLSALVASRYGKSYFLKSAKQTTGIASINSTQLKSFPTVIPPIHLQTQFADIVGKVEIATNIYRQSLTDLQNLYGALSQRAFKGELDLSHVPLVKIADDQLAIELGDKLSVESDAIDTHIANLDSAAMATADGRKRLLQQSFTSWLQSPSNQGTSSMTEFWRTARMNALDYSDEENGVPEFSLTDYDALKQWVFDEIAQSRISQTLNTKIVPADEISSGSEIVLRKAK